MKKITSILILTFVCLFNTSYSQTKTPYEKQVDQIMTEMCKAIGVDNTLLQLAIKMNDWDIVRTSQDFAFKCKLLDQNELKAIVVATQFRLKEAEKLKIDEDFKKKIEKEEKEKQAIELKNQKDLIKYSDLTQIKEEIYSYFNNWVNKGEFETNIDYQARMDNKEIIINRITYYFVSKRVNSLRENCNRYYLELKKYDPDKQFYAINLVRRIYNEIDKGQLNTYYDENIPINDTLIVSIEFAKRIKEESTKDRFNIGSDVDIIWFCNKAIFFSQNINNWVINSNGFFFPKYYSLFEEYKHTINMSNTSLDKLILNTNELGLQEHFPSNYVIDFGKLGIKTIDFNLDIKRDKIIKQANRLSIHEDKLEAFELYQEANKILFTDDVKSKIDEIEPIVIERQKELIESAKEYENNGNISASIEKLEIANKLITKEEISKKINALKQEYFESLKKYKVLDSIFSLASIEKSNLFKETGTRIALDEVKDGYGAEYQICEGRITTKINSLWYQISESNTEMTFKGKRGVWNDKSSDLLQKINDFRNELNKYSKFEINIKKALKEKDKKFLKIFKEEDEDIIINTIIKSN